MRDSIRDNASFEDAGLVFVFGLLAIPYNEVIKCQIKLSTRCNRIYPGLIFRTVQPSSFGHGVCIEIVLGFRMSIQYPCHDNALTIAVLK